MQNSRISKILIDNDRDGERAIALFQALIAGIVFAFHLVSASRSQWQTFSLTTIGVACFILIACMVRYRLTFNMEQNRFKFHALSVIDCALIFWLIGSYSQAYGIPIGSSFKAPSIIFLMVFTAIRLLRFDPVSILVSGVSVLIGWFSFLGMALYSGDRLTTSYVDYIEGKGVLVGAVMEIAAGYALIILVLVIVTVYARRFLSRTAHIEDLAEANIRAEDTVTQLESVLNSSIDGVVIVDADGIVQRVNPAVEKLFGFKSEELVGRSAAALMSEENEAALRAGISQYVKAGESPLVGQVFESQGRNRAGNIIPIELSINEFFGGPDRLFAAFIRNISERRRAEAREKKALEQFQDAVKLAMDAIIIIDEAGDVVDINPAAEEIFGFEAEELRGQNMGDHIVPAVHRKAHDNGMKHYLKTGEGPVLNKRIEIEGLHKSGTLFDLELAIKDIDGPNGKLFIGYARDITQRKQNEVALLEAKETAEIANRAKASFLAMMSHEIRTPLNGVLGIIGLLQEEKLTAKQLRLLKTANISGRALLTILNDILDFSKLEAGKLEIEKRPFLMDPLINSVVSLIDPSAKLKDVTVLSDMAQNVPAAVSGDSDRVRQVLLNLASNAVKFTEKGQVSISVDIAGGANNKDASSQVLRFTVTDTGCGIPADKHDDLFAEFSTIDARYSRKYGGTGLGLAICKSLVENMDGEIGFESTAGKGSSFWFELPLASADEKDVYALEAIDTTEPIPTGTNLSVLVAEDNATNQLVATSLLEKLGANVHLVGNGQEAVKICSIKKFDLILMDVSMPEMDGLEATRHIKEGDGKNTETPIVALTAYALDEDRQRVLAAGMDGFMSKPLNKVELMKTVAAFAGGLEKGEANKDRPQLDMSDENLLFDLDIADGIFHDMDAPSITAVVDEFGRDVRRYVELLEDALANGDVDQTEKASHGLKGVAGIFGATELSRLADGLNTVCRTKSKMPKKTDIKSTVLQAQKVLESALVLEKRYLDLQDEKRGE